MKAPLRFLLFPLIVLAGCTPATKTERFSGCGDFTLTNATGVSTGTVFWGTLQDVTTNDIQFILILPETAGIGGGGKTRADASYNYWDLKIKRNDHQWRIEALGNLNTGVESLQVLNVTAHTAANVNLRQSRFWRVSEDGMLTPLDKVDAVITGTILHESEASLKRVLLLQK